MGINLRWHVYLHHFFMLYLTTTNARHVKITFLQFESSKCNLKCYTMNLYHWVIRRTWNWIYLNYDLMKNRNEIIWSRNVLCPITIIYIIVNSKYKETPSFDASCWPKFFRTIILYQIWELSKQNQIPNLNQ